MPLSVYFGYDRSDSQIINSLYSILKQNRINVYAVETEYPRNETIFKQINDFMNKSDILFFFLTQNSVRNMNVIQEIGMARTKVHKEMILLVESGVVLPSNLADLKFFTWNRYNPQELLNQIENYTLNSKQKKESSSISGILLLLGALGIIMSISQDDNNGDIKKEGK